MSLKAVSHDNLRLAYEIYGNGTEIVVAMHGHSKSAEDFQFLANDNRTIISIHLFHHQHSYFPVQRILSNPLNATEWRIIFQKLLDQEALDSFHLIGFSQGGRFALKSYEFFNDKVKSLTLLSPDGINLNGFYDRASKKKINLLAMKFFEKNPKMFYATIRLVEKLGKVHSSVTELAEDFSYSPERMIRASHSWQNFRELKSEPKIIGDLIQKNKTPFRLVMGKYDGIFPPQIAYSFLKEAGLPLEPIIIECGHDFFKPNTKELFAAHLPF